MNLRVALHGTLWTREDFFSPPFRFTFARFQRQGDQVTLGVRDASSKVESSRGPEKYSLSLNYDYFKNHFRNRSTLYFCYTIRNFLLRDFIKYKQNHVNWRFRTCAFCMGAHRFKCNHSTSGLCKYQYLLLNSSICSAMRYNFIRQKNI